MHVQAFLSTAVAILVTLGAVAPASTSSAAPSVVSAPADDLRALDGDWIYLEDRTEGQPLERLGPPMASKFSMKVEEGAVFLNGHGSGHKDVRVAIDGTPTEVKEQNRVATYRGSWKDGTFDYKVEFTRASDGAHDGSIKWIRRSFQMTPDGLVVRVSHEPSSGTEQVGLYRHAEDIEMPDPAAATIGDLEWLAGNWVGKRSSGSSIEERWSPPLGGAMLAVSRSVNTAGKMVAFEYLRVVERGGALYYVAQPGGKTATEFVCTELSETRAVFDNPRHDYPKRIVYELSAEGGLSATVGFMKGGTPRRYEFEREDG